MDEVNNVVIHAIKPTDTFWVVYIPGNWNISKEIWSGHKNKLTGDYYWKHERQRKLAIANVI